MGVYLTFHTKDLDDQFLLISTDCVCRSDLNVYDGDNSYPPEFGDYTDAYLKNLNIKFKKFIEQFDKDDWSSPYLCMDINFVKCEITFNDYKGWSDDIIYSIKLTNKFLKKNNIKLRNFTVSYSGDDTMGLLSVIDDKIIRYEIEAYSGDTLQDSTTIEY